MASVARKTTSEGQERVGTVPARDRTLRDTGRGRGGAVLSHVDALPVRGVAAARPGPMSAAVGLAQPSAPGRQAPRHAGGGAWAARGAAGHAGRAPAISRGGGVLRQSDGCRRALRVFFSRLLRHPQPLPVWVARPSRRRPVAPGPPGSPAASVPASRCRRRLVSSPARTRVPLVSGGAASPRLFLLPGRARAPRCGRRRATPGSRLPPPYRARPPARGPFWRSRVARAGTALFRLRARARDGVGDPSHVPRRRASRWGWRRG